jgi:acyl transferase domain-containing protein/NAD(P)-dependent dehydrogenase (short-subunit alcohol dehydrogenase family)/acyl carrier protein
MMQIDPNININSVHTQSQHEPLAIVGMGCRFPKDLASIDKLLQALRTKFSAIDTVPADRWTVDRYYSANPIAKGKAYMHRGGFLNQDVSTFDAAFFGISPRDAENMDPQQRLLLEVVWEAFENAGIDLPGYAGKSVGVYVGGFMLDHMITQMSQPNRSIINQNTATGMMMTMLSNRISHTFDLRGPSMSIDTACSSSLVAFHYACQDLWNGVTEMAVVGGANVMLRPEYPMGMCKGHFLARDGECKSFDSRADGYGRGEGAGAVLLKPLAQALADGDPILATVLGTGSNQDGHTPGISMPSGEAQQALIREVCDRYSIDPQEVRYVECHGTGTAIGDPTEAGAIGSVYGAARQDVSPVVIGSVKSNIGHLEAAAGVAGIIKAVLTLMYRQALPLANLQEPNPNIPFDDLNVRLADDLIELGRADEEFCAAVNSFGYGGTNAHAVLRTAPVAAPTASGSLDEPEVRKFPHFLPLSARSPKAVAAVAGKYAQLLNDGGSLEDVLYSASFKRAHLSHSAVVKGHDRSQLILALEALSRNEENDDIIQGVEPYQGHRKPVFVFTGMGPQWWAMGQELYRDEPIYRAAVDEADAVFTEVAGFSILAEMLKSEEDSQIGRTVFAQPSNLIIQIGLLAVLRAAGVEAGAVVGHSVGELGSAYAAGVLNLRDTMTVCYHRSRLQATCAGTGAMMAVGLSKEKALERIGHCLDLVSVAAVNSPTTVTLAGDETELQKLGAALTAEGIFNRQLEVEVPYHSPIMDRIMQPLTEALANVRPSVPQLPLYSTVTGGLIEAVSYGADYWPLNMRQSVEFATAISAILADGYNTFLEVGPHPVLATSLRDCIKAADKDCRTAYTLRRKSPELSSVHRSIASIYTSGCNIDWQVHNGTGKFIQLPNYAWQRDRLWLENDRGVQERIAPVDLPILGIQEAPATPMWRNDFDHEPVLYLRDHVVTGVPILPAAGYIEALLELAKLQFEDANALVIRNLRILAPMIITAERGLDCVTSFDPLTGMATIRGLENGRLGVGQVHITGKIAGLESFKPSKLDIHFLLEQFPTTEDVPAFYQSLAQVNLNYGPAFQTVRQLRVDRSGGRVLSRIKMQPELTGNFSQYCIHPTVLDACFQSLIAMLEGSDTTYLPTGFSEMCVYAKQVPANIWCLSEIVARTDKNIDCNLTLLDDEGNIVATIRGMRSTAAAKKERTDRFGDKVKRQILGYEWTYGETLNEAKRLGYWLVVGADSKIAPELIQRLESYGAMGISPVSIGDKFNGDNEQLTLKAGDVGDASLFLNQCGELDGIVFLHGLTATANSSDPTGEKAIETLIAFSQALIKQPRERQPRVYVVTQGAFAVNEQDKNIQPSQSALNGFTRVAFNELEGLRFSSIDLPAKVNEDTVESLALELLCDDLHDEVALRGNFRLVSELVDSNMLTVDRVQYMNLDDTNPILVRPLLADVESVGMARILAFTPPKLGADDIQLRIQSTIVPPNLLLDTSSEVLGQPTIEIVAEVMAVGCNIADLRTGMRVCGFAPADLASQMSGNRSQFQLVPIPDTANAADLVSTIGAATRAERSIESLELSSNDTALVYADELGLVIADALRRRGLSVALLWDDTEQLDYQTVERYPIFSICPEAIQRAIGEQTNGKGFTVMVAPMQQWTKSFDLGMLQIGGCAIDTDTVASPLTVDGQTIARTDMSLLLQRPQRLQQALQRVIAEIINGTISPLPNLEISIIDLAWQKLGLAITSSIVLNYETQGRDLPVVQADSLKFNPHATYLITGGFGGFGQKTAEWLIDNGAKYLVLTGRTGADNDERKALIHNLCAKGALVTYAACDTADYAQLTKLFAQIERKLPPLKGVFHSGAQIIDQPIGEIDLDTFHKVMRSKALGAWNLHLLTQSIELDHFVLYSSIANLVGNARQSAYSAANGFLNGLAHLRHAQGLPGTSVNWGAIADVGVVAQDEQLEQFLRYTGLRGINTSEALEVLKVSLARNATQFGVTVISSWADWARFETRGATSPRFASLIAADSAGKDNSMRDILIEELSQLDPSDQVELLGSLIVEIIASVLKSDPASIPIDSALSQLGVDSLMATEFQLQLDAKLGLSISIMELLGDVTIRSLSRQSLKTLLVTGGGVAPVLTLVV